MTENKTIETIRKVKERKFKLSQLRDLKLSELKAEHGEDDFCFLEEDLRSRITEKLQEKGYKAEDIKLYYSLSYSQGDGLCFIGNVETPTAIFKITHSNRYFHEYSTDISITQLKIKEDFVYFEDLTNKQRERAEKIQASFIEEYRQLCKETAKIGYSIIEETQKDNVLRRGFNDFLELNDISQDGIKELYDYDYSTQEKKGYIKIAEHGDTSIRGLWIKDLTLNKLYEVVTYNPQVITTTRII